MTADLALVLVTDPGMTAARGLVPTVLAAVAGGVTMVQLRDKQAGDAELLRLARELKACLRWTGARLVVNDRVEVACAAGADGVHLGQEDGDPAQARALLGPDAILGLSVTHPSQAAAVDPDIVSYVGLGPIYATGTKPDAAAPLGPDAIRALRPSLALPIVAIGGIGPQNAREVVAAGADGIAVVSALCAAADPAEAARALRRAVQEGKQA